MVFKICPACTITICVSFLSFGCCDSVCPWFICNGIASEFISASFSASMRAAMPCFPGTNFPRLIAISCRRLDSYSILCCLSPKSLHTSCILIGLQQQSETCFPPIHIPNVLVKNSSCGPETAIYGPGPSSEYTGYPNIVDALGLMNLSTMEPIVLT